MKNKKTIKLNNQPLTVENVVSIGRDKTKIKPTQSSLNKIQNNWDAITEMLDRGDVMYGLNTGIGGFGNVLLSKEKAGELSTRMLKAHSAGWDDLSTKQSRQVLKITDTINT